MDDRKPHILILDDRADELDGLKLLLEDDGYDVTLTESALSLPFVVRATEPDVLLVDVNMPWLSGERLLRNIPRSALKTTAQFVLFSGMPPIELAVLAEKIGADGFIYKGEDLTIVLDQIKHFVERRRLALAAPRV